MIDFALPSKDELTRVLDGVLESAQQDGIALPDLDQEPTDLTIAEVLTDFVPLSKTMGDQITGLRTWARGRARFATSPQTDRRLRKLAT